jgi:hypothetical protein
MWTEGECDGEKIRPRGFSPIPDCEKKRGKTPYLCNLQKLVRDKLLLDNRYVRFTERPPPDDPFFFTNSMLCLKQPFYTDDDGVHPSEFPCNSRYFDNGWSDTCAEQFMMAQIKIVQPMVVFTMGLHATRALFHAVAKDPAQIRAKETVEELLKQGTLERMMWKTFDTVPQQRVKINTTEASGSEAADAIVFPIYHCGGMSARNRPHKKQARDWDQIVAELKERVEGQPSIWDSLALFRTKQGQ